MEAGILKPESLSEQVLQIIAEKVGVKFEKLVLMEGEDIPVEARRRVAYSDLIAGAVDLSLETSHKYLDALRVMKPTNTKAAWENTDNYWMRVEVGSDDYMQALADHFVVADQDGSMRILRKPKTQSGPRRSVCLSLS